MMQPSRKPRVVLTYGTFDLFHHGHVNLLRRLADLGTELIVGCSTDAFNQIKGKQCVMSYEQRRTILESCRYVDRVIPEDTWEQKRCDIVNYNVSTFAMGDDWTGKFDDLQDIAQVLYLPRTPEVSTTELRAQIGDRERRAMGR
ncbi:MULTISPECIES: glycerol-3-phosphate cytidylyltransferase [unclassified Sulfitobacter]|uniref:glycerol-3-phosphate cytidylyltransferase n=2 Tax=Sulfitobacter TaxID=60136 RepID=UPI000A85594F|nr:MULTISPECIES: glycerol-3-phosphate cytidylyltransferase [unclassified Sulfitobacter]